MILTPNVLLFLSLQPFKINVLYSGKAGPIRVVSVSSSVMSSGRRRERTSQTSVMLTALPGESVRLLPSDLAAPPRSWLCPHEDNPIQLLQFEMQERKEIKTFKQVTAMWLTDRRQ